MIGNALETKYTLPVMKTVKETVTETGIPYKTLLRFCRTGKIKYIKVGNAFMINMDSLAEYMRTGERA